MSESPDGDSTFQSLARYAKIGRHLKIPIVTKRLTDAGQSSSHESSYA
jgi:hypothetical protein